MLRLLEAGCTDVVVALASDADPVAVVTMAAELGYRVVDFLAMGLDYGPYSSEPKVAEHIRALVAGGPGWAGERGCMVAVTLFTRDPALPGDRAGELLSALQLPGQVHAPPVPDDAVQQRVA